MLESERVFTALRDAGVITDPTEVSRVVIEAMRGRYAVVHVERIAGDKVLDVVRTLSGPLITEPGDDEAEATVTPLPSEASKNAVTLATIRDWVDRAVKDGGPDAYLRAVRVVEAILDAHDLPPGAPAVIGPQGDR